MSLRRFWLRYPAPAQTVKEPPRPSCGLVHVIQYDQAENVWRCVDCGEISFRGKTL